MRRFFLYLIFLILLPSSPLRAEPVGPSLTAHVTDQALREVLNNIALAIDQIKNQFPQLENWKEAEIFPTRIEYHHRRCQLLIFSKETPIFESGDERPTELKAGVYLKMKVIGSKSDLLKETLLYIIEREFQRIRNLHHPS